MTLLLSQCLLVWIIDLVDGLISVPCALDVVKLLDLLDMEEAIHQGRDVPWPEAAAINHKLAHQIADDSNAANKGY